jgi:metallophosphoesterase superfamily enzyme
MKVAILTDTHYGARKGSKLFHDYFEQFYKNIFFPTLEQYGITTVIHMGDAFDSRKSIDYQSLDWAKRVVFEPLKKYDVHMIVGNHDSYYKNTNSTNSPQLLLKGLS